MSVGSVLLGGSHWALNVFQCVMCEISACVCVCVRTHVSIRVCVSFLQKFASFPTLTFLLKCFDSAHITLTALHQHPLSAQSVGSESSSHCTSGCLNPLTASGPSELFHSQGVAHPSSGGGALQLQPSTEGWLTLCHCESKIQKNKWLMSWNTFAVIYTCNGSNVQYSNLDHANTDHTTCQWSFWSLTQKVNAFLADVMSSKSNILKAI